MRSVRAIREEWADDWAEWQTWPEVFRPSTGDLVSDAVLANPTLFEADGLVDPLHNGRVLATSYALPRSAICGDNQELGYQSVQAAAIIAACKLRPVSTGALCPGMVRVRRGKRLQEVEFLIFYDLRKLLEEGPWTLDALE